MPTGSRFVLAGFLFCAGLVQANGASLQTIYTFKGGADGQNPTGSLAMQKDGTLFGSTTTGGRKQGGTVYMLTPPAGGQMDWSEAIIAEFTKTSDGKMPSGGVIIAGKSILGTATFDGGPSRCGTAFRIHEGKTKGWIIQPIWSFADTQGGDGCEPNGPLTQGPNGTLYGATNFGGASQDGMIFSLTPPGAGQTQWTETDLYDFTTPQAGREPQGRLLLGADGSLYGTSQSTGGPGGGVFKLAPPAEGQTGWTFSILFGFTDDDCDGPSPLVADSTGTLYATCFGGGSKGSGMVFSLTPPAQGGTTWTESALWNFPNYENGSNPRNGVIIGLGGALYGTTYTPGGTSGYGTIYKLLPPVGGNARRSRAGGGAWRLRRLWTFSQTDGANPDGPLTAVGNKLIGTTSSGGANGDGTVFVLTL